MDRDASGVLVGRQACLKRRGQSIVFVDLLMEVAVAVAVEAAWIRRGTSDKEGRLGDRTSARDRFRHPPCFRANHLGT